MRGVVAIDLLVFGICFIVMAVFTFLPPIVLTGLIAMFLGLAFLAVLRSSNTVVCSGGLSSQPPGAFGPQNSQNNIEGNCWERGRPRPH
jgi:hypothetical protein